MIQAVLFDMDGILCDSELFYMEGTLAQMRSFGYTGPEEKIWSVIGTTMDVTYQILYELLDGKIPVSQLKETNERYFEEHPCNYLEIRFAGVKEVLCDLKSKGFLLACCSSSPLKTVRQALKEMEIEEYFDYIQSGEEIENPKPAPDIYRMAAEELHVSAEECVVYEDSELGIRSGKSAGMYVIAREDARFKQDQSDADVLVHDIREMEKILLKEYEYETGN